MTQDVCESANVHFSPEEEGQISEWVKDKRRGGNGQRDKEEERKTQKKEEATRHESGGEHWK